MSGPLLVGIDVGGTKLAGIAVDGERVVAQVHRPLSQADVAGQVVEVARDLAGPLGGRPDAIGIAVPGQVDTRRGIVELAVNLGVRDLPLGSLVADALDAPTAVEHDARAVAGWLVDEGGDPAPVTLAYLSVGTGISAGVVVDGVVLRGTAGLAGEIGHVVADPSGERCACGLAGCLETVASGPSVARAARRLVASGAASSLPADPTSEQVFRAAGNGDALACDVVDRATTHLAAAIRGLALAYGIGRIVVGGGVARAGRAFAEPLLAAVERERAASGLVERALRDVPIEVLEDDRPIGALGAVALARRHISDSAPGGGEVGTR